MKPGKLAFPALAAALFISGIPATGPSPAAAAPARNWNNVVTTTPSGAHVLGNPAAPLKLVEYVSYTCPHCAHFEQQSEVAIRLGYVQPGKVSVEVRNYVRDAVDLAAALLTNCGPPQGFFLRHTAFLRSQDRWIATLTNAGERQRQRWSTPDFKTRMRYVASDFGFYALAASRGIDRPTADRCLADEAKARQLAAMSAEGDNLGVTGTPSFLINGLLLAGTHDWRTLEFQLQARM